LDKGIWITWYDLPENGRDVLSGSRNVYSGALLKRPGYQWAAHYAAVEKARAVPTRDTRNTDDPAFRPEIAICF
jgi:hypothetical protein